MHPSGGTEAPTGYRLSRVEVERQGRWSSFLGSAAVAAVLWAVQFPAWMTAQGHWPTMFPVDAVVPARISLVLDLGLIVAYVLVAYRAVELMWSSRGPRMLRYLGYLGMGGVMVGAVLDVVENVVLWVEVDGTVAPVALRVGFTPVMLALVGGGLALVSLVAVLASPGFWWKREGTTAVRRRVWSAAGSPGVEGDRPATGAVRWVLAVMKRTGDQDPAAVIDRWRGVLEDHASDEDGADRAGTVICCSGGGIRSASFCLGGLQVLAEEGKYQEAEAVIGVSGGGYTAAAYHVLRWRSADHADPGEDAGEEAPAWPELADPPVYGTTSPELQWLRRHSRYLFDSTKEATRGLLSLLFGIAVNLFLLGAVLGGVAWWLGWMLQASGGISGVMTPEAAGGGYSGAWEWVQHLWWLPVVGVGLFVAEKVCDRFVTPPLRVRAMLRTSSVYLLWGGLAVIALLLGLPHAMAALHNYAAGSGSAYAGLIHATGLIPSEVCEALLASGQDACGRPAAAVGGAATPASASTVSAVSLASVIAAILAVVKAAQRSFSADSEAGTGRRALLRRVWRRIRDHVVPWLAVVVIGVLCLAMTLRWTVAFVTRPDLLSNWGLAYAFGVGLIAVKLGTDANRTSLHHFYRERLSHAFLVRREGRRITPVDYKIPLRFSQSSPPEGKGPRLVSCAVANVSDPDIVPADRHCTPFVFDDHQIGLTDHLLPAGANLTASSIYEFASDLHRRDATIPAAMAMSGAAFSPLAGRQNGRLGPYRAVLALANARLGVWLPNPIWVDDLGIVKRLIRLRDAAEALPAWNRLGIADAELLFREYLSAGDRAWLRRVARGHRDTEKPDGHGLNHIDETWFRREDTTGQRLALSGFYKAFENVRNILNKPGAYRLVKEAFGRTSVLDRRLYITDGGHYDNLGLVEALRRRARTIYVLDASSDPEDSFSALGDAIATARIDLGCEVSFDPRTMRKLDKDRSTAAWGEGTATYSDGETAAIHLVKVIMLDGLPWDLEAYAAGNPQFPRTSTTNQFYGEFDLEAYRILGREVTRRLLHPPPDAESADRPLEAGTVTVDALTVGAPIEPVAPSPDAVAGAPTNGGPTDG